MAYSAGAPARHIARTPSPRALAAGLVAPSLILALAVIGYPLVEIVRLSLSSVSRFGVIRGFVGLDNFATVAADPVFQAALLRTLLWTLLVVGGTLLVSLPASLVLNRPFHGRGLARTIIMLPWAISLSMAAIVWLWSFNGDHGLINASLTKLGLLSGPLQWMATPATAFAVEVLVGILVSVPFTITILLGGLAAINPDIYEAAGLDGARPRQAFAYLTWPLLRPFIAIAVVLNTIYVFNSFPIIWVMTQGGPDNGTHILVTYLYELAFRLGRPGPAAAVSLVMLVIVLGVTAIYLRMQGREEPA